MHIAFQEKKHKAADTELLQKNEVVSSTETSGQIISRNYSTVQQVPKDLCLKHLGQTKHKYLKMWIAENLETECFIWIQTKTVYFYFLQQYMPNASKQACRKSVKPAACWPYAMHISKHTFPFEFFLLYQIHWSFLVTLPPLLASQVVPVV